MPARRGTRGNQATQEGTRLQGETRDLREGLAKLESEVRIIGELLIVAAEAAVPNGWHRANGATLITSRYPRLAKACGASGDMFTIPAHAPGAGLLAYVWGPPG
jgi:hypothetical protein